MKEQLKALLEGQTLSAEFGAKLEALVELAASEQKDAALSALTEQHVTEIATLKEQHEAEVTDLKEKANQFAKEIQETTVDELTEKVDKFFDFVISEWANDNEVALDGSLKIEIAESFLSGMKNLFEQANVTVPEGKNDVVETLESKITSLKGRLNEAIEAGVALTDEVNTMRKERVVEKVTDGMVETQALRVSKLAENIDYTDEETFTIKVKTLREGIEAGEKTPTQSLTEEKTTKGGSTSSVVKQVLEML